MPRIPIFPLDVVVYPGEPLPLHIFEERYCMMVEDVLLDERPIGVALMQLDEAEEWAQIEHAPENIGTAVHVLATEQLPDGRYILLTVGHQRFEVLDVVSDRLYQEADVVWLPEPEGGADEADAAMDAVEGELTRLGVPEVADEAPGPVELSYAVASALDAPLPVKQQLLEAPDATERLLLELALLGRAQPVVGGIN